MMKKFDALVSDLLCSHLGDPANAPYLSPLDREREEMAQAMADAGYSAAAECFADNITVEQRDRVHRQCLVDARRMLLDEDYARIFEE